MGKLIVAGCIESPRFQRAKSIAEAIRRVPGQEMAVEIRELFEVDWEFFLNESRKTFPAKILLNLKDPVMCYHGTQGFIGGVDELHAYASERYSVGDDDGETDYEAQVKQSFVEYVNSSKNTFVYMNIQSRGRIIGTLAFELQSSIPKASENFKALCTGENDGGLRYKDCPIHRIVKDGWVQSGDIATGNGDHSESIYGGVFEDESFEVKHDRAGILSMSNVGPHSNGSQFFITMRCLEHLDTRKVAFGKLIYGYSTLKVLNRIPTTNERPTKNTTIADCGLFDPNEVLP